VQKKDHHLMLLFFYKLTIKMMGGIMDISWNLVLAKCAGICAAQVKSSATKGLILGTSDGTPVPVCPTLVMRDLKYVTWRGLEQIPQTMEATGSSETMPNFCHNKCRHFP
jgi:hypothetical protein